MSSFRPPAPSTPHTTRSPAATALMQQVQLAETIQKEHASYVQTQGNTAAALLQRMEERYDAVKEAEEGLNLTEFFNLCEIK